jgi:hypothetical protein
MPRRQTARSRSPPSLGRASRSFACSSDPARCGSATRRSGHDRSTRERATTATVRPDASSLDRIAPNFDDHAVTTTSARTRRDSDWTLVDHSLSVKVKLAGLWTAMMLLYGYADILSFYRPGEIAEIESGKLGPFKVSQSSLVIASVIVIVPALMIALSSSSDRSCDRRMARRSGSLHGEP